RDRKTVLDILDAPDRLAWIKQRGPFVYIFWRDAANPKGLWRRTTLESYRTAQPAWDTIIDLDALAKAEGEDWVWSGATPFEAEPVVCECEPEDMQAFGYTQDSPRFPRTFFLRQTDFENGLLYVEGKDGTHHHVDVPSDADTEVEEDWLVLTLRTEWEVG